MSISAHPSLACRIVWTLQNANLTSRSEQELSAIMAERKFLQPTLSDDLKSAIEGLVEKAFQEGVSQGRARAYTEGYNAGLENMRLAIMKAAAVPVAGPPKVLPPPPRPAVAQQAREKAHRAPRGSVRKALTDIFEDAPWGISMADIESAIDELGGEVSAKSASSELRRLRDKRYRFENGQWFLIASKGEMETAEGAESPTAVPATSATMEENRAPDTTIIT